VNKSSKGFIQIIIPIILSLVALAGIGYFALKNRQVKMNPSQNKITSTLSPIISKEVEAKNIGYSGYNLEGKRYSLSLPNECNEKDYGKDAGQFSRFQTTCTTEKFKITINPQEGGRGWGDYQPAEVKTGKFPVGKYEWDYQIWLDADRTAFSSYSLTDPETQDYYLIGVRYDPYSETARNYFNQILSTFKFIDPGLDNWKIHTDVKYGFEFRYPKAWNDFGSGDSSGYFKTDSNNTLNLTIYTDSSKTITEYLQKKDKLSETSYEGSPAYQVQSTKKTVINGLSCVQRTEYLNAADITTLATYFKNKNYIVSLTLVPTPGNALEQDQSYYNQILSTFEFIAQENTPTEPPESIQIQM
jgi:hypothetical protein